MDRVAALPSRSTRWDLEGAGEARQLARGLMMAGGDRRKAEPS